MSALIGECQQTETWNVVPGSVINFSVKSKNAGTLPPGRYLVTYELLPYAAESASAETVSEILGEIRSRGTVKT